MAWTSRSVENGAGVVAYIIKRIRHESNETTWRKMRRNVKRPADERRNGVAYQYGRISEERKRRRNEKWRHQYDIGVVNWRKKKKSRRNERK
jgi:hypothetical protein